MDGLNTSELTDRVYNQGFTQIEAHLYNSVFAE